MHCFNSSSHATEDERQDVDFLDTRGIKNELIEPLSLEKKNKIN